MTRAERAPRAASARPCASRCRRAGRSEPGRGAAGFRFEGEEVAARFSVHAPAAARAGRLRGARGGHRRRPRVPRRRTRSSRTTTSRSATSSIPPRGPRPGPRRARGARASSVGYVMGAGDEVAGRPSGSSACRSRCSDRRRRWPSATCRASRPSSPASAPTRCGRTCARTTSACWTTWAAGGHLVVQYNKRGLQLLAADPAPARLASADGRRRQPVRALPGVDAASDPRRQRPHPTASPRHRRRRVTDENAPVAHPRARPPARSRRPTASGPRTGRAGSRSAGTLFPGRARPALRRAAVA